MVTMVSATPVMVSCLSVTGHWESISTWSTPQGSPTTQCTRYVFYSHTTCIHNQSVYQVNIQLRGKTIEDVTIYVFSIWQTNGNSVRQQIHAYYIPKNPVLTGRRLCVPMAEIGFALNGVPVFNPLTAEANNAVQVNGISQMIFLHFYYPLK